MPRWSSCFGASDAKSAGRTRRRDTIIIGGGATNRGVETSVREAFNQDIASVVVRECCGSSDAAAHAYSLNNAMRMYWRIRHLEQVVTMLRT